MKLKNYLLWAALLFATASANGVLSAQNIVSPADNYGALMNFTDEYAAESFFLSPIYDSDYNLSGFGLGSILKFLYVRNDKGELMSKAIYYIDNDIESSTMIEAFQMNDDSKKSIVYLSTDRETEPSFLYAISSSGDNFKEAIKTSNSRYYSNYTSFSNVKCESKKRYNEAGQLVSEFITYMKQDYDNSSKYRLREYGYDGQGRRISVKEFVADSLGIDKGDEVYSSNVYFGDNTIRIEDKILSEDYTEDSLILEIKLDNNNRITEQNGFLNGEQIINNRYSYTKKGETVSDTNTKFIGLLIKNFPVMNMLFGELTVKYKDTYDKNALTTLYNIVVDSYEFLITLKNTYDKKGRNTESLIKYHSEFDYNNYSQKAIKTYSKDGLTVEISSYKRNNDTEPFELSSKNINRYDDKGRLIRVEQYMDNYSFYETDEEISEGDRKLVPYYASEYTYDDANRLRSFSYSYPGDDGVFKMHTKTEYLEYNEIGLPISQKSYFWNTDINDWTLSMVSENRYDPYSYELSGMEYKYWDSELSEYNGGYRYEYNYDISEKIQSITIGSYLDVYIGDWVYNSKTERFYDEYSYIEYAWDKEQSEWIPQEKYEDYEYYTWNAYKQEWELYSYDDDYEYGNTSYNDKYQHKLSDEKKPRYIKW